MSREYNCMVPFPRHCVEREEWGAEPYTYAKILAHPLTSVILTHTNTPRCETKRECIDIVLSIQQRDKDRGQRDIRYNFLVGGDGRVYEGRSWTIRPKKSKMYPEQFGESIEISFIGFKGTKPTLKELKASWRLIKKGIYNMYMIKELTYYADM